MHWSRAVLSSLTSSLGPEVSSGASGGETTLRIAYDDLRYHHHCHERYQEHHHERYHEHLHEHHRHEYHHYEHYHEYLHENPHHEHHHHHHEHHHDHLRGGAPLVART